MGLLYQKRRLKVNKIRRQIQAMRTLLQRIRVLLSLVMIVVIIYGCTYLLKLPQWYFDIDKLYKADPSVLKIQGNIITPNYKIIEMIRQTKFPDVQIFRLSTKELEENISQLQSVKNVYVRRYWFPARLVIALEERTPAFLLTPNLGTAPTSALTVDGVLLDHDYLPLAPAIKAKKLLTYGVRNGVEEIWDKKRVEEILKLIKAIETYSDQEVQYIDLRNEKDAYIMLDKYLIRFGEIDDTALKRAKLIGSVLTGAAQYKDRLKYVDLRWEESSYLRLEGSKEKEINYEQNPKTNIIDDEEENLNQQTTQEKPKTKTQEQQAEVQRAAKQIIPKEEKSEEENKKQLAPLEIEEIDAEEKEIAPVPSNSEILD